jgi:hypothetical protein
MRKILKTATVLSWINMIFWSLACLLGLLLVLASGTLAMLIILIFPSAIVLHSYAAFQLQKSIRNPAVPLSSQTSTGIRFIGFVALFVGISTLFQGIGIIQHGKDYLKQMLDLQKSMKDQMSLKNVDFVPTLSWVRMVGVFSILIGLCVAVNVNLNFRLLRWYYFQRDNQGK